jgi:hypothetical protein
MVEDGVAAPEKIERQIIYSDLLQEIYQLRAAIAASRDGEKIDMISAIIELNRNERDAEILGLL